MKMKLYFLFIPIADKKKFLCLMVSALDDEMAIGLVKQEMLRMFPGDQEVTDNEIIHFHELNYSGDVLAEIMKMGPKGELEGSSWIAIMKDGQAYTIEGIKDREEVKKEFKKHVGKNHPNMNFTEDLYSLVGEEHVVLLQVDFTDEFLNTMNFTKLVVMKPSPTIH